MTINTNLHNIKSAQHDALPNVENDCLKFSDDDGNEVNLFVSPHVAKAVSEAFNQAIEAEAER